MIEFWKRGKGPLWGKKASRGNRRARGGSDGGFGRE